MGLGNNSHEDPVKAGQEAAHQAIIENLQKQDAVDIPPIEEKTVNRGTPHVTLAGPRSCDFMTRKNQVIVR